MNMVYKKKKKEKLVQGKGEKNKLICIQIKNGIKFQIKKQN